jgi:hypothetical protein
LLRFLLLWAGTLPASQTGSSVVTFHTWRRIHRAAALLVSFIGIVHCGVTFLMYSEWSPDAVWFLGTGLSLVFLAAMNVAHVGIEPCDLPTAPAVLWGNFVFAGFGIAAAIAVAEPQGYVVLAGLIVQAIAGLATLRPPQHQV